MFSIIKNRRIWFSISAALVIASILGLFVFGIRQGIDFTGGSLLELAFTGQRPTQQAIVDVISQHVPSPTVQLVGEQGMILRFSETTEETHQAIVASVASLYEVQELRYDSIGPTIGNELKRKTAWAIGIVSLAIIAYIAFAFRKVSKPIASWKYGLIALVALLHDILITLGAFVLLGVLYGIEINAPFVAAILTILGYSVNDTIVVFDRLRENLLKRGSEEFSKIVQTSINETLTRSINSSSTTLFVLLAVLVLGGTTIRDFVLALIIGITVGTYSSIFIAAPLLVTWEKIRNRG